MLYLNTIVWYFKLMLLYTLTALHFCGKFFFLHFIYLIAMVATDSVYLWREEGGGEVWICTLKMLKEYIFSCFSSLSTSSLFIACTPACPVCVFLFPSPCMWQRYPEKDDLISRYIFTHRSVLTNSRWAACGGRSLMTQAYGNIPNNRDNKASALHKTMALLGLH